MRLIGIPEVLDASMTGGGRIEPITVGPDRFLVVSKSLAGPAFYESIIAILRDRLPPPTVVELTKSRNET
jgi:hypothetical protein